MAREEDEEQACTLYCAHYAVAYVPQSPQLLAATRQEVSLVPSPHGAMYRWASTVGESATLGFGGGLLMVGVGWTHRATGTRTLASTSTTLARRVVRTHAPGSPLVEERPRAAEFGPSTAGMYSMSVGRPHADYMRQTIGRQGTMAERSPRQRSPGVS